MPPLSMPVPRIRILIAALAALTAVATLSAQERERVQTFTITTNRARLGIMVDTRADAEKDRVGARVREVTPDGPADKAGLKAGDVITKFNGKPLGGLKADSDSASGPGQKLIELARALDPGDTVKVEYKRGSETRTATIVARDLPSTMMGMGPGMGRMGVELPDMPELMEGRELPRMMFRGFEGGPGTFDVRIGGPWGGLDLITLNPDLGEYFGTREGVLVASTPKDSTVPLKGGDVILSIDGRTPQSADHALRILRSYEGGETVKLDIMRKQKRTSVSWKVPEEKAPFGTRSRDKVRIRRPAVERS